MAAERASDVLRTPAGIEHLLLDEASDVLYLFDPQGKILFVNRAVERISGYKVAEVMGRNVFEFLDPSSLPTARAHHLAKVEGKEERSVYEALMRRKDGSATWIEISSRAVWEGGRLVAIQGALRDVAERHRAEQALRASEERYRELVEDANDVVYTHSLDGRFLSTNATAVRTYGYTREEFLEMSISSIVDPAYLAKAQQEMRLKLQGISDRSPPYELLTRAKDGSPVWVEVSTRLMRRGGRPSAVQGIARDITARKAAEAIARDREAQYRSLAEGVPVGLFRTAPDGRVLEANAALVRILRAPNLTSVVGHPVSSFYADPTGRASLLEDAVREGTVQFEERVKRLDGTLGWVRGTTRAVRGPEGAVVHFEGHVEDVTAEKEASGAIGLVQDLSLELNRASDFRGALAVTLRTLCELTGWKYGESWIQGPGRTLQVAEVRSGDDPALGKFRRLAEKVEASPGEGLVGQAWSDGRTRYVPDLAREPSFQRAASAQAAGLRMAAVIPVRDRDGPVAALLFLHPVARPEDARWLETAESAARQLGAVMARRRSEDRLRRRTRILQAQLEAVGDGILVVSIEGEILSANQRLLTMCGVQTLPAVASGEDDGSRPFSEGVSDPKRFLSRVRFLYEGPGAETTLEGRTYSRRTTDLLDEDELILGRVHFFHDVTQERVMANKLKGRAARGNPS